MAILFFLLTILACTASNHAATYVCSTRKPCILNNVVLESETELEQASFPDINDPLTIASGKIPNFTRKLSEKLEKIFDLTMNRVECETVFIRPEMVHLEATDNRINTLLVDDNKDRSYELLSLNLTNNQFSKIGVLPRFTKLRLLALDGNGLELVSMDTFGKLSDLRHLSLANNKLYTLDTSGTFQLDKLQYLSLAGNPLLDLNIEQWELASLKELDLSGNKLYWMSGSLERFKQLKQARIAGNYWKCEKLMSMVLASSSVIVDQDSSDRCSSQGLTVVQNICCEEDASKILGISEPELFGDKWEQIKDLDKAVQEMKDSWGEHKMQLTKEISAKEAAQEKRFTLVEEHLKKLNEKIAEKESKVAIDETNQLKDVVTDHKKSITKLEQKQLELNKQLEEFVERLSSMRESLEQKITTVAELAEKNSKPESVPNSSIAPESVGKSASNLEASLKHLENQQFKYHMSSIDLKNQINTERGRINDVLKQLVTLSRESELLKHEVDQARGNISMMTRMIDEIAIIDD
ncbi:uncharacterized protein LOC131693858 [Topomyia yanbarensis]|uniref:uncharacterized protein LOC131693858 n=1 Tax=Topomyia yanbarensis TaxID=2498891 RepID=UPI00273C916C|nr:uncharacterized protein LOC131693858 [Topomyia yanbarensis]